MNERSGSTCELVQQVPAGGGKVSLPAICRFRQLDLCAGVRSNYSRSSMNFMILVVVEVVAIAAWLFEACCAGQG